MRKARPDPVEDAAGGERARLAGTPARDATAEDVRAALRHEVQISRRRVHVAAGPEASAERGDGLCVAAKKPFAFLALEQRRHREYRLTAAEREAGDGHLDGHPRRQPRPVAKRVSCAPVDLHPRASRGRPQPPRVDADKDPALGRCVEADEHLLSLPRRDHALEFAEFPHRSHEPDVVPPLQRRAYFRPSASVAPELLYSARGRADYDALADDLLGFPNLSVDDRVEAKARRAQAALARRGQHRGPTAVDLLIAAIAEAHGVILLHYDRHFDLIARATGQEVEWLARRGALG